MKKRVIKSKSATPKNPGGQPTHYKEEYCEQIVEHMATGQSLISFANKINKHKDTIYEWAKVHPKFSDALQLAKQKCEHYWENEGQKCFTNRRLNADWWKFYMKARFRWTEPQEIKQDTTNINVEAKAEDVNELAKQLEAAALSRAKFSSL